MQAGWAGHQQPYPPPYQPPRAPNRRRWLWISAAAVVVIAVAATATVLLIDKGVVATGEPTWTGANDGGRTGGTYPTEPEPGWSLSLRDVEEASGEDLDGLEFEYPSNYGDVVLVSVGASDEAALAQLVAVKSDSGEILWTTPSEGHQTYRCASEIVDGLLACVRDLTDESSGGPRELRFYDVATGDLVRTLEPEGLQHADVADGAVYSGGVDGDTAWVTRGTPDDLEAGWRVEYPANSCSVDDWVYANRGERFVNFGGVLIDKETGERFNDAETSGVIVRDDLIAVASPASSCGGEHEYRLMDDSGSTRWTHPATEDGIAVGPDDASVYYIGPTAFDVDDGTELWTASGGALVERAIGSTVLATDDRGTEDEYSDDVTIGLDSDDGSVMWRLDDSTYCFINDGERCIADFYDVDGSDARAYNLATGDYDWTLGEVDNMAPAGDGFVTTTTTRMKYYPPSE